MTTQALPIIMTDVLVSGICWVTTPTLPYHDDRFPSLRTVSSDRNHVRSELVNIYLHRRAGSLDMYFVKDQ